MNDRVALRPARPGDAALLHQWRSEPTVRRFQPLTQLSPGQIRAELGARRPAAIYESLGDRFDWIILVDGHPAGWLTLVVHSWDHGLGECGYALSTAFQGRGLMPRALALLLLDLFERTTLWRLEARCAVDNRASQRVLDRLGFTREGTLRGYFLLDGERVDNHLYALTRADWEAGKGRLAPAAG